MSSSRRLDMVKRDHDELSIARQCCLLGISRSSVYAKPRGESEENLALMREIDRAFTDKPFLGVRQMRALLRLRGYEVGLKRVRRLMRQMHLMPIYQRPKTTVPHPEDKRYPYLLRDMEISAPNQVWCADITYIPMRKGFLYLVAIMDWYSRKVLSWRLSASMEKGITLKSGQTIAPALRWKAKRSSWQTPCSPPAPPSRLASRNC